MTGSPATEDPTAELPPVRRVRWSQAFRIIPTRFPPVSLFERIGDPAEWEVLAEIEFAPKKTPDAAATTPSAREAAPLELARIELVWIEGKGAALLDGARVASLSFAKEPARVTVSGAGAVVGTHAVLERVGAK